MIVFGAGAQELRHVPRDRVGGVRVVSSASVLIERVFKADDDVDRVLLTGAASVDTTSTTTSAAAGPQTSDARTVSLTSLTGVVAGRTYLLTDAAGRREGVVVEAVLAAGVRLTGPLAQPFASGSTFVAASIAATFPALEADDEEAFERGGGPYLVTWTYTIDGVSRRVQGVEFVRRDLGSCPATDADLREADPFLGSHLHGGQVSLRELLAAAWRGVRIDLLARGIQPENLYQPEIARGLVVQRALAQLYRNAAISGGDAADRYADAADRQDARARELLDALSRGLDKPGTVQIHEQTRRAPEGGSRLTRNRVVRA